MCAAEAAQARVLGGGFAYAIAADRVLENVCNYLEELQKISIEKDGTRE